MSFFECPTRHVCGGVTRGIALPSPLKAFRRFFCKLYYLHRPRLPADKRKYVNSQCGQKRKTLLKAMIARCVVCLILLSVHDHYRRACAVASPSIAVEDVL